LLYVGVLRQGRGAALALAVFSLKKQQQKMPFVFKTAKAH
jgi:hypothetical protein